MQFPEGKNISGNHPFSTAILEKSLHAVFGAKREVNGYLRIRCGAAGVYFLFFLKNSVYAAGKYFGLRPKSLTIMEFFTEVTSSNPEGMTASLHEADTMLLKDFLIFIQDEPTVKVPVNMIDLDAVVRQIAEEQSNALVVLESDGFHNFFHFDEGKPASSHFSETCAGMDGLSIDEQMLLYAYRPGKKVDAYTYRNIVTTKSVDADDGSHATILKMLYALLNPVETVSTAADPFHQVNNETAPAAVKKVKVLISDGVEKGTSRSMNVPFTIGRKEGELIIADPLVSKRHAVIREISGALVIEDLGSTNGTFVNDVEIKLQQLTDGDLIKVGSSVFQLLPD